MVSFRVFCVAMVLAAAMATGVWAAEKPPKVVTSIKPVHALVAAVMNGVGDPHLLVRGAASPHDFVLKPSDARALADADAVFWIGPELESFLARALTSLAAKARHTALHAISGIRLRPFRDTGYDKHEDTHAHAANDMHIWLDPANAIAMVRAIASNLSEIDPGRGAVYGGNAEHVIREIETLDGDLGQMLRPLAGRPYVVFHNAYQYLETRYGLAPIAAITLHPDGHPGAARIKDIRRRITAAKARCIFSEPQYPSRLIATVSAGTGVHVAILDPLGAALPQGPNTYTALMRKLAGALSDCLTVKSAE